MIKASQYSYGKNQTHPIFNGSGKDLDHEASRDGAGDQDFYVGSNVNRSVMVGDGESEWKEKKYGTAAGRDDGKPKGANLYARSGIGYNRPPH
jgi:hypothetical protein